MEEITLATALGVVDRLLAADMHDLPIPNIAVAGQQSVGKSSLLSLLLNVPLWCAEGMATCGPTQIHSRKTDDDFTARIEIQYGTERKLFTTTPLTVPGQLVAALQAAGDEARKGARGFRTLEELKLSEERPITVEHTRNLVLLFVSGRDQPDLSIIDLPGLVTQDGQAITEATARTYLAREGTLILLCLAAGGADPSFGLEVDLVAECDPIGARTIGIITKADLIQSARSSWCDLVRGTHRHVKYFPKLGWRPVRLRTHDEFEASLGNDELEAITEKLFSKPFWVELANSLDRDWSWRSLSALILAEFHSRVKASLPILRERVEEKLAKTVDVEKTLPAEIAYPHRHLFSLVEKVHDALRCKFTEKLMETRAMLDLQLGLITDISQTTPVFNPVLREDHDRGGIATPGPVSPESEPSSSVDSNTPAPPIDDTCDVKPDEHRTPFFLDSLHPELMYHCNARSGNTRSDKVWHKLIKEYSAPFDDICHDINRRTWQRVTEIISDTVSEVTVAEGHPNPAIGGEFTRILRNHQQGFEEESRRFITQQLKYEKESPSDVDPCISLTKESDDLLAKHIGTFRRTYLSTRTPVATPVSVPDLPDGRSVILGSVVHQYDPAARGIPAHESDGPAKWPILYRNKVLTLGTVTQQYLQESGYRLAVAVSRQIQVLLHNYLGQVSDVLREGLNLEPDEAGKRRAKRLLEPSEEIVQKKEEIKRRRVDLEKLQEILG